MGELSEVQRNKLKEQEAGASGESAMSAAKFTAKGGYPTAKTGSGPAPKYDDKSTWGGKGSFGEAMSAWREGSVAASAAGKAERK